MTNPPSAPSGPIFVTVSLETPLVRGEQTIEQVQLRKPASGELRGCSLVGLSQLDFAELRRVIPRITQPVLTEADVDRLDPADLVAIGAEVSGFLLPKALRPD